MNDKFMNKCNEIFEEKNSMDYSSEINKLQEYFNFKISDEYIYILENFSGVYLCDEYGFKSLEKTLLTENNGYDRFSYFFSLNGENNIYDKYRIYQQQLPSDLIPIGDLDGGNLLCINKTSGFIFIWIHDKIGKNIYLASRNIYEFICSIEKKPYETQENYGDVKSNFSDGFLQALRTYNK